MTLATAARCLAKLLPSQIGVPPPLKLPPGHAFNVSLPVLVTGGASRG